MYNKKILNVKPYSLNRHQAWSKNNKNGIIKLDWNEATKSIFVGLEKHLQNVSSLKKMLVFHFDKGQGSK